MSWGPRPRRVLAALVLAAAALILGVAQASTASAHAQIVSSNPVEGANLATAPSTLTLVMSEPVELRYTRISLRDSADHETALTGIRIGFAPAGSVPATQPGTSAGKTPVAVEAELPPLVPDLYRIAWTTLSSDDLHTTSGVVVFGVQRAVARRSALPADPLPSAGETVARWVALLGMGTASGAAVLLLLLRGAGGHSVTDGSAQAPVRALLRRRLFRLITGAALVAVAADVARLLLQAHGTGAGWITPAAHLLTGSYGVRWSGRELAALGVALIAMIVLRAGVGSATGSAVRLLERSSLDRRWVPGTILVLGACYALGMSLTGHSGAGASQHPLRVLVETIHVSAALTWAGALVAALATAWRGRLAPTGTGTGTASAATSPATAATVAAAVRRAMLARFGLVAAGCLALMTVTGLLLTGSVVASADALIGSVYGRMLLLKLAFVVLSLSAAAVTALTVHPALVPFRMRAVLPVVQLRSALALEAAAALVVLLGAAGLAAAQPATGATWTPAPAAQPIMSATTGDLVQTLQVAPNRPGQNFVTLDVFDSRRQAPARITAVQILLTGPGGQSASTVATSQGGGRWLVPTGVLGVPGRWAVDVQVSRAGLPVSSHRYDWIVADPGAVVRHPVISDRPLRDVLGPIAAGLLVLATLLGLAAFYRIHGRRRPNPAPGPLSLVTQTGPGRGDPAGDATARITPVPVPRSSGRR